MKCITALVLISVFIMGCSGSASDSEEVEIPDKEVIDDIGDLDGDDNNDAGDNGDVGGDIIYTQAPLLASINRTLLFSGAEIVVSGSYFEYATVSLNGAIIETTEQTDNIAAFIAPDLEAGNYILELRNDYGSIEIDVQYSDYILASDVATGENHACAVTKDSTVLCWGENEYGQLGDGTLINSTTPVAVTGLTNVTRVAVGSLHSCALKSDKSVACWGSNSYGNLGNGADLGDDINDDSTVPLTVTGLTDAIGISAGDIHTCAIKEDATVVCWGFGGYGRLGNGGSTSTSVPLAVVGLSDVVQVSAGRLSTCAVKSDGSAMCWGNNGYGLLGDGTSDNSLVPVTVLDLDNAVSVATKGDHACALKDDNSIACWGHNGYGQLGEGTDITQSATPIAMANIDNAINISSGYRHSCATLADGTVKCWGANTYGQLGSSDFVSFSAQPLDVVNLTGVSSVSNGKYFNCALLENERISCWGDNNSGQYGDGTITDDSLPSAVSGVEAAVSIAANESNTCAVSIGGTADCWGENLNGQLLNGSTDSSNVPVTLSSIGSVSQIDMGGLYDINGCAVTENKTVMCWGDNDRGQLGNGTTEDVSEPVVVSGLTNAIDVSLGIGSSFACALKDDQTVACWGRNYNGALGGDVFNDSSVPVTVSELDDAIAITTGNFFGCALKADGTVACWGNNSNGELGNNSTTSSYTPVLVNNLDDIVNISAGENFVCAVHADKTVSCWGRNSYGQINDSADARVLTPVLIDSLSDITSVHLGKHHACVLHDDKTVSCWGRNNYGQLGNGTTVNTSTPSPVLNLSNIVDVSGGVRHTCALYEKGTMACWGRNNSGQLGLGNPSPTYVLQVPTSSL